jgi:acetyl esterase/lipase
VCGNLNRKTRLRILKIFLKGLCYATLLVGILFTVVLLIPIRNGLLISISYFITQITGFLMLFYLLTTILLLKLTTRKRTRNWNKITISAVGLSLTIINALPLIVTPITIQTAEQEFEAAYGIDWMDEIPPEVEFHFLPSQFNFYSYFLGFPHRDCNIDTNILYYNADGIRLYFDVYYPRDSNRALPGNNSIIIKIHGGSWQYGDKTLGNVLVLNEYLAAQGYVVFDIQYGLFDAGGSSFIPTPDYVKGNFTLHDMVSQIGNFTKQLESTFAVQYHGNLDSVFIMGGSAGGQLTGVIGLGYNDPYFAGNFSTNLNIKGIVPIYPPDFAPSFLLPGEPPFSFEKFTPSKLVDTNDPPAIIFQGLRDDLVPLSSPLAIKNALISNGIKCMLLTFPFAAHASDLIAGNSYSQVWIYYLERFLYLEQ